MTTVHVPILVQPIVDGLIEPFRALPEGAPPHWIVDCTLGGGGHAGALLGALEADPRLSKHRLLGIDQDAQAIARARERFQKELGEGRLELLHARFSEIGPALEAKSALGQPVLAMMADLGFSSDQMDDPSRGLSFRSEGTLDMRLDPSRGQSCRQYLSQVREEELARILWEYGEERFSRRIASSVVSARRERRLPETPKQLADLIVKAIPGSARHGKIHAATRSFQALRIELNDELGELDAWLAHGILHVRKGGRVAVLTFHSLEDRRVKQRFRDSESGFERCTKKPLVAGDAEVRENPRARSAKLRLAERVG